MKVIFKTCITNYQDLYSPSDKLRAKLLFTIDDNDYECILNIPDGGQGDYEDNPIEVTSPVPQIAINYGEFRDAAENYYRSCVGSKGNGIRINDSTNISITNFMQNKLYEVNISNAE